MMIKRTFIALALGGLVAAGASMMPQAAVAQNDLAPALEGALDRVDAEYTRHNREHRMAEIQWNVDRQRYYGRRGYGPPRGYGYGYGHGYGPPRGYGYGYRRHYDDWDD